MKIFYYILCNIVTILCGVLTTMIFILANDYDEHKSLNCLGAIFALTTILLARHTIIYNKD